MTYHHISVMGAINNNSANVYLTISDGRICRRVQSPTQFSKERINKEGRQVHEEHYNGWSGKIVGIETRESEYGKDWQVKMQDEDGIAILSFKYSSGYASSFLKALPNVDLSKDVTLSPNVKVEGEKKRTTLFIKQDGQPIKWHYTKDNPNGIPPMKQIKVKGVSTWDDSEMMEFLEDMVKAKFADNDVPF